MAVEPGRHYKVMEVCGGHTHSIYKYGIDDLLPANVELVHGPGCPVCVIPMGRVDDAIAMAHEPNVIFTCFGDMMRVPGSRGHAHRRERGEGADIRMVYSPLDALRIAKANPDRDVVFFAIGFETTAPSTALTLKRAKAEGVPNFFCFCNHVTIVPPLRALLESPDLRLDGFVGPGHVSTVVGARPVRVHPRRLRQAGRRLGVRAGRHPPVGPDDPAPARRGPLRGREPVQARRPLRRQRAALRVMAEVFELRPHFEWRGLGFISHSGLEAHRGLRRARRGAPLHGPERPHRRPEGVPVRRGPQGRHQAVRVQGLRHRLHARAPDRHLHGLERGRLRGLLQLRPLRAGARALSERRATRSPSARTRSSGSSRPRARSATSSATSASRPRTARAGRRPRR